MLGKHKHHKKIRLRDNYYPSTPKYQISKNIADGEFCTRGSLQQIPGKPEDSGEM